MASNWALSSTSPPLAKRPKLGLAPYPESSGSVLGGSSDEVSVSGGESWYRPSRDGLDSGYSDGSTPPASCDDSQESFTCGLSRDIEEEDPVELNLETMLKAKSTGESQDESSPSSSRVGTTSPAGPSTYFPTYGDATDVLDDGSRDNDDALSDISGITDLSESDWKSSDIAGPFSWVQQQMMKGTDPRELLQGMVSDATVIPNDLDHFTLWKIILNMLSEPPRRNKLSDVNTIEDVVSLLKKSRNILVLTGAGVSVSCGIPDFRSRDGVYARLAVDFPDLPDPQAMFDIRYFRKDPRPFFKFAREIYPGQFEPSPCHRFIRCLEKHDKLLRNYTQNIDTLEQVVGIKKVVQCHGSFATATCTKCGHKVEAEAIKEDIFNQCIPLCPKCKVNNPEVKFPWESEVSKQAPSWIPGSTNGPTVPPYPERESNEYPGIMKPDIVFFGEDLGSEFHDSISRDKDKVDCLVIIGSSLKVRPVALIPSSIPGTVPQILINRESLSHLTPDVELLGDCDGIINQICHSLGDGWKDPIHLPELTEGDELIESLKENEEEREREVEEVEDPQNKKKSSLAQRLPDGQFCFQPPARYIFPGAEVFSSDSESDDDEPSQSNKENGNNNESASVDNSVNNDA